ncbi:MAG: hypothetical protein ACM3X3_10775 [Betaproteobacteria bacterium]
MNKRRTKKAMKKLAEGRPLTDLERRAAAKAIADDLRNLRKAAEELRRRMPELQDGFRRAIESLAARLAAMLGGKV